MRGATGTMPVPRVLAAGVTHSVPPMNITCDWHIHSHNSCDQACMLVPDLVREAREKGISDFGLTDHLNTPFNLPDIAASHADFLAAGPSAGFRFGVEVSCVSQWELDEIAAGRHEAPVWGLRSGGPAGCELAIGITAEDIAEHGIEYVVGGVHWPMYVPFETEAVIRDYHRQNMFLATHPLVDVVAHPWWWMGHWEDADGCYRDEPWLGDFGVIPKSIHDEFASAALEHGTVVEINIGAHLLNRRYPEHFAPRYLEYLADLQTRGVRLTMGSDCHAAHYAVDFPKVADMLERAGIADAFWCPPPRP